MYLKKSSFAKKVFPSVLASTVLLSSIGSASAAEVQGKNVLVKSAMQLEYLDRGLVATTTSEGIFLSWRFLGNEATGFSATGLTGTNFNVYRDGIKIATVEDSSNYLDKGAAATSKYYVKAVVNGKEVDQSAEVSPWTSNYFELKLRKPSDQIMPKGVLFPNGEVVTYEANDMSVGDVDGDGQYEYFVKWYPSNAKDVSQRGYTGNTYIDCYKSDGTLLYRLDLGINVRSGAHYTQFMVYDFDGDGKAETMMKTAPGTKIINYDKEGNVTSEKYITMPQSDIDAGYSNTDDYRLSAEGYFNHVVDMFMNWDKHPEVVNGNWPKTIEACLGKTDKTYTYPLSKEDATELANYFIDVYAPSRNVNNKLREFEGFILTGPEYLTVFNGESGDEMKTIPYKTERDDDGLLWGDYAMARIEPGNRVDRFLAGVAYLDGKKPYALFARGYYTRTTMVTYSWDGKDLKENWYVDSGHAPMTNPFNDGPHGRDGSNPEYGNITTQGAHSLSIADVDGDGFDEIVYGSATIDHDGKVLYSSFGVLPAGSANPGATVRLGHGDALHVADIDPSRPGLEIFMCHEGATYAPYGSSLRDAKTGEVIYGLFRNKDNGRAMIGDVDPTKPGLETWSNGFWDAKGNVISGTPLGTNANIKWAANMTTQTVDGSGTTAPYISAWDYANTKKPVTVFKTEGTLTNNGTKGNPSLVADVFGDWREELLVRTTDSSAIRIYTSTEVTNHKMYTLMHDAKYRTDVARQNTTYNQPAYTSFYFGSDTDWSKVPLPKFWAPNLVTATESYLNKSITSGEINGPVADKLVNTFSQAKHQIEKGSLNEAVKFVDKYLSDVNEKTKKDTISDRALLNLRNYAKLLKDMLTNGSL
jgi:rhamnogalacturonan endolyase